MGCKIARNFLSLVDIVHLQKLDSIQGVNGKPELIFLSFFKALKKRMEDFKHELTILLHPRYIIRMSKLICIFQSKYYLPST